MVAVRNRTDARTALERTTFTTSRLLEFFSESELQLQIGHPRALWPLALLKELIDNALDACESTSTLPAITIELDEDTLTVSDNGPGLPEATLRASLDYQTRTSDKTHYITPTRGRLGNALKCVWAAPFVCDGKQGRVVVRAGGTRYQIDVSLDRIAQTPRLDLTTEPDTTVKTGTSIRLVWPGIASYLTGPTGTPFYSAAAELVQKYAIFNPHACLTLRAGKSVLTLPATSDTCTKWSPADPPSPHWYRPDDLRALIAATLGSMDRDRTVRALVRGFAGLSGSAKQKIVAEAAGLGSATLADLVASNDIDMTTVRRLLEAMQEAARPLRPAALGEIGEQHLRRVLEPYLFVTPDSMKYKRVQGIANDLPFVLEVGFGIRRERAEYSRRGIVVGLNWAPALDMPVRELYGMAGAARLDAHDPVVLVVHLACPRLEYTDRGKAALTLPSAIVTAMEQSIRTVTSAWKQQKRNADREGRLDAQQLAWLRKARKRKEITIKDASYRVMEEAYIETSGGQPANARQIMYQARPNVLALTGGRIWKNADSFTQHHLPDFIKEHPKLTADWNVVFDARGHLVEPHTGRRVDLGTLGVRRYIAGWQDGNSTVSCPGLVYEFPSAGPAHRYSTTLFIEKEGFTELLAAAQIAARYDIAIMSTKGLSTTAARELVEALSEAGVQILVAHDFDKSGFSIMDTLLHDTRRWTYRGRPRVIDIGLRLADIQAMGLQSEPVTYDAERDPRLRLASYGATTDEQDFLVRGRRSGQWVGERVELNAMTSPQFIAWLEQHLAANGVEKIVPDHETLLAAYQDAQRLAVVQRAMESAWKGFRPASAPLPTELEATVRSAVTGSADAWDNVIRQLVEQQAS